MDDNIKKKDIQIIDGKMYYFGYNLEELANKYQTPLRITFLDIIKERVLNLKNTFDKVIKEEDYQAKFIYLNANKANYGALEVKEALINGDGLETSSFLDLSFSYDLIKKYAKDKYLVSNGFKDDNYLNEIIKVSNDDINYICIIDSLDEYEFLKKKAKKINVGLRIHLPALYASDEEVVKNDRFGLMRDEIKYIVEDIKNHKNMTLSTIHFHQRGFDYDKEKFMENIDKCFLDFYVEIKKLYPSLVNFDIGGGTPLPTLYDFDYESWARLLIKHLKDICLKNNIEVPNIISENGKYSMKDSTIDIYKVVGYKETDRNFKNPKNNDKFYPWYVLDGSLLIALPEMYALGEEILIEPINNLNDEMREARLASITCDCDDIYFKEDKGYILMPKRSDKNQYVACLGVGSYQNSMNGKGGVHHCMLPEETDLVIYKKDNKDVYLLRSKLQTLDEIKKLIKYDLEK